MTLLTNSVLLICSSTVRISSSESDEDDEELLSSEGMISHVLDVAIALRCTVPDYRKYLLISVEVEMLRGLLKISAS